MALKPYVPPGAGTGKWERDEEDGKKKEKHINQGFSLAFDSWEADKEILQ